MSGAANRRADIVVREIEVIPNGREQSLVFNGRLDTAVQHTLSFPRGFHRGREQDLRAALSRPAEPGDRGHGQPSCACPFGCFEQTSSATYPNVLALDYMKRTGKLTPEVHAKAEGFIANGYQRLLTFEVPSGGFSWFGQAPANKILTAYGLMEFYDMSQVHDVDPKVIQRTQQWLAGQQQAGRELAARHQLHQRRRHQPLSTPTICASPLISPGRSKTRATRGRRWRRRGNSSNST